MTGLFKYNTVNDKDLIIVTRDEKGSPKQFNHNQVKLHLPESLDTNYMKSSHSALSPYILDNSPDLPTVFLTKFIAATNPRTKSQETCRAIYDEVKYPTHLGASKVTFRHELPDDANMLIFRFRLAFKSSLDVTTFYKERFLIDGYLDKLEHFPVYDTQTVRQSSVRPLHILASLLGFHSLSIDVQLSYLQYVSSLQRRVSACNPADELELAPDEFLELLKPLYVLATVTIHRMRRYINN